MDTDTFSDTRAAETKDQLRFITCGSVDDGKSTLIGRVEPPGLHQQIDDLAGRFGRRGGRCVYPELGLLGGLVR